MVLASGRQNPEELAAALLRERETLLEQQAEIVALQARVAAYEQKFGIPSAWIHDAIDRGELIETLEVCDWIMDVEQLQQESAAAR